MSTKELIESAAEHLRTSASVKTVYGDPVIVDGRTIIPVARVAYGFGGGTGTKRGSALPEGAERKANQEEGEGAGGGMSAKPVGVVEIGPEETKFVAFGNARKLALTALIGSGVGLIVGLVLRGRGARR
ncbi:MAG TPA: spore germination protein GerW family protein [Gemmatimonadales bacterium]|nr:spore germination protein GerW family protein [Gemmatimonadales bacterium]